MKPDRALLFCELPYGNSLDRFAQIRPLGHAVLLDSGDSYQDHIDVYTAAPVRTCVLNAQNQDLPQALSDLRHQLKAYEVKARPNHPAPGWFGVWSYDLGEITESIRIKRDDSDLPLLWMGFYPALIVSNHRTRQTQLVTLEGFEAQGEQLKAAYLSATPEPPHASPADIAFSLVDEFVGDMPPAVYRQLFSQVQEYICSGDCYQINLAQRFQAPFTGSPWQAYRKLRQQQTAPMGGYIETEQWALLSLSPERFIRCTDRSVEAKPIKGTRPRSADMTMDAQLKYDLQHSDKDRAENLMIVDLLRNDLGRTCEIGSVRVDKLFDIESFSAVHHMVSTITGTLKPDLDVLDLLVGAFPGGSITGAPKRRAMEVIEELEPNGRGLYCGSLLYVDVCGRMDSSILIRSLVARQGMISCSGGGGVVADSTCDAEYQEIQDKIGNLLKSLQ
ncbi:aminodeoxychorismate synthase component I [Ketobacter alkanivorans]|uniref:aminodeoxychorismate synthase n=1 Tax=Ketobacter alkanivorans TaxID=1917421 RepID=A0A2K9LI15_9GAMM|nr:aminodeoxychorismate synthase component I [Ketobacter alkanivorans]AUM11145.1 aminodeoxychorismate synthase, component I [Ketobacter alkanivorans]